MVLHRMHDDFTIMYFQTQRVKDRRDSTTDHSYLHGSQLLQQITAFIDDYIDHPDKDHVSFTRFGHSRKATTMQYNITYAPVLSSS